MIVFIALATWALGEFIVNLVFGCCYRKFKNGRKCRMWSCPNQKDCKFSFYYEG